MQELFSFVQVADAVAVSSLAASPPVDQPSAAVSSPSPRPSDMSASAELPASDHSAASPSAHAWSPSRSPNLATGLTATYSTTPTMRGVSACARDNQEAQNKQVRFMY